MRTLALIMLATAASGTAASMISAYTYRSRSAWAARGIALPWTFPRLLTLAVAVSAVTGALTAPAAGTFTSTTAALSVPATVGAWTALTVFSTATDLTTQRVPKDLIWATGALTTVLLTVTAVTQHAWAVVVLALTASVTLTVLGLISRLLTQWIGGTAALGWSDVRILTVAGLSTGWWVPAPYLLYAVIAACIVQLAARLVLRYAAHSAHATDPRPSAVPDVTGIPAVSAWRRSLPFAPALTITITAAAILVSLTHTTTCVTWPGLC